MYGDIDSLAHPHFFDLAMRYLRGSRRASGYRARGATLAHCFVAFVFSVEITETRAYQTRDVITSFTEGRDFDDKDAKPVVEIISKPQMLPA